MCYAGKIAAQVGHAAVGCYKRAKRQCPSALSAWERTGCAKIAVKCPTEEEMEIIYAKALSVLSGGRWQDSNSSWLTHCVRIGTSTSKRV
jgi:peptidyl-tRNA hydrolase